MHDDGVVFITILHQFNFVTKFLVLQLQTLYIKLRLPIISGSQENESGQFFAGAILICGKNFYPELAKLHAMQQVTRIPFNVTGVGKECLPSPLSITARAIWVRIHRLVKTIPSDVLRLRFITRHSIQALLFKFDSITPLVLMTKSPAVAAVHPSVLADIIWVSINDGFKLSYDVIKLSGVSRLAFVAKVPDIS